MKNTGVVRRLDELGRITLPMELRKVFGTEEAGGPGKAGEEIKAG